MAPLRVIVAGGRKFHNYNVAFGVISHMLSKCYQGAEIVSGGACGADSLGERYARENRCNLKIFPAEWEKFGLGAGFKRNKEMAEYADALIAFWDGKSSGTRHMINRAKERGLRIVVVDFNGKEYKDLRN